MCLVRQSGAVLLLGLLGMGEISSAQAAGSHFLVEPFTGVVFNHGYQREDAVGLESGALFAFGGKFKGFPPRFYLYFRAAHSFFGQDDVIALPHQAPGTVERSFTTLMGGLRIVIPMWSNLRMNLETGVGGLLSRNRYTESGIDVRYDEDYTVVEIGAGLNYRLFSWLSLGLMYDYLFPAGDDYGDMITAMTGDTRQGVSVGWSRLTLTAGFHF